MMELRWGRNGARECISALNPKRHVVIRSCAFVRAFGSAVVNTVSAETVNHEAAREFSDPKGFIVEQVCAQSRCRFIESNKILILICNAVALNRQRRFKHQQPSLSFRMRSDRLWSQARIQHDSCLTDSIRHEG